MRALNIPMRRALALPYAIPPSRRLMLLFVTGRKSGRAYQVPLSYVRDGDALLTPGGGRWTHNLVDGRAERIRLGGRDIQARAEIVSDVDTVDDLLETIVRGNPMAGRFVAIPRGADGRLDRTRLSAAIAHGFRVIRWHPQPAAA